MFNGLTCPGSFNRRPSEFTSLLAYNDYLEEVETVTFNLLNGIDMAATEAKLATYAAQNAASISHNTALQRHESESLAANAEAEREQARLRREAARREEEEARKEKLEDKKEVLDQLAHSSAADASKIAREGQAVLLKRSSARRNVPALPAAAAAVENGSATEQASYFIRGLKPVVAPEPEKAFDPFGGYADARSYFVRGDSYEHPWLDRARSDPTITAGGYDVGEYCGRALVEASAGLGVFVADELGRAGRLDAVPTRAAAEGAGRNASDSVS